VRAVRNGLARAHSIDRAVFVLFTDEAFRAFERALRDFAGEH
jgi:O-acetyl-ADP-ribose deacetylase (regulator of RNase III)